MSYKLFNRLAKYNPYTDSGKEIKVTPGQYRGLLVSFIGTTGAGTVVEQLRDSFPKITINRGGTESEVKSGVMNVINAMDFGRSVLSNIITTASQVFEILCYVPFHLPHVPNVYDIVGAEEMKVTIDADKLLYGTTGLLVTPYIRLYGVMDPSGFERYRLAIKHETITKTASQTVMGLLQGRNIARMVIREGISTEPVTGSTDVTFDITNLKISVDDTTIYDDIVDILRGFTGMKSKGGGVLRSYLAAAGAATITDVLAENKFATRLYDLDLCQNGVLNTGFNNVVAYEIGCDAAVTGYVEVTKYMIEPSGIADASRDRRNTRLEAMYSFAKSQPPAPQSQSPSQARVGSYAPPNVSFN